MDRKDHVIIASVPVYLQHKQCNAGFHDLQEIAGRQVGDHATIHKHSPAVFRPPTSPPYRRREVRIS